MAKSNTVEFAAYVGIDWADKKHDICLQAADRTEREYLVLEHRPEAIEEWANDLRSRFDRIFRRNKLVFLYKSIR